MVISKQPFQMLAAFAFMLTSYMSYGAGAGEAQAEQTPKEKVSAFIDHHLKDDYYYTFFSDAEKGKNYGFALPVILFDDGMKIFSSSEFEYGQKVVEKDGKKYALYHGKVYHANSDDMATAITYDDQHHATNTKPINFSITKNVVGLFFATVLLFLGFTALAKTYKSGPNALPKGVGRVLEPLVLFVRDEMARPNIGEAKYRTFMPYLLSVFFMIFLLNLLGLTPLGLNVTGNISVTFCLALFTFLFTNLKANKDYWMHIFWMPGVPVLMKLILAPIEVLGMFTKPFSLMIRLFANNVAGHSVIMGLVSVAFLMKEQLTTPGAVGIAFFLTTFITILKILVAFLQAFIFTMLSSLFIGMAVQDHEHEHEHEHAH